MIKTLLLATVLMGQSIGMDTPQQDGVDWPPAKGAWTETFQFPNLPTFSLEHTPTGIFLPGMFSIMGQRTIEELDAMMQKLHSPDVDPQKKKRFTTWIPEGVMIQVQLPHQKPLTLQFLTSQTREEFATNVEMLSSIHLPQNTYMGYLDLGVHSGSTVGYRQIEGRFELTEAEEQEIDAIMGQDLFPFFGGDREVFQDDEGYIQNDVDNLDEMISKTVMQQIIERLHKVRMPLLIKLIGELRQDLGSPKYSEENRQQLKKQVAILEGVYSQRKGR